MERFVRITRLGVISVSLTFFLSHASISFAQKTHRFKPTKYYYTYDAKHEPVLKLKPGDILITSTVDAFGNKISSGHNTRWECGRSEVHGGGKVSEEVLTSIYFTSLTAAFKTFFVSLF